MLSPEKEKEATIDPFIGSIGAAATAAPSGVSFETHSLSQEPKKAALHQEVGDDDHVSLMTFEQKKVFWESRPNVIKQLSGQFKQRVTLIFLMSLTWLHDLKQPLRKLQFQHREN